MTGIDQLDAALLSMLAEDPRPGVLECSRRLGVARGTVQARLDRLRARGVIQGFAPQLDPGALGYPVTAFATLEISQGQGPEVRAHLASVPEVLELHTITGQGDMLCRIAGLSVQRVQRFPAQLRSPAIGATVPASAAHPPLSIRRTP